MSQFRIASENHPPRSRWMRWADLVHGSKSHSKEYICAIRYLGSHLRGWGASMNLQWLPVLANVVPGVTVFLMISAGSAQKEVDSPSANPDTIHLPSAAASVPDKPNSLSSHDVPKCIERTVQESVPGWRRSKTADPS